MNEIRAAIEAEEATPPPAQIPGGLSVARALKDSGVTAIFGVHGSANPFVEEACHLGIQMYHFRHEQSAGFAAEAYARATRSPGVAFTSNAPGIANIVSPIYQAKGASSPLVVLNGSPGVVMDGMNGLQEAYPAQMFPGIVKWAHRVETSQTLGFWTRRALIDSVKPVPGPIVVDYPYDKLIDRGPDEQLRYLSTGRLPALVSSAGDPEHVERLMDLLTHAERPVIVAGDGVYWSRGEAELVELAEAMQVPVYCRRTARGSVPERHPLSVVAGLRRGFLDSADLVILLGMQVSYLDEWFEAPDWNPHANFIQVAESPDQIWSALPGEFAMLGASRSVLRQMLALAPKYVDRVERSGWITLLTERKKTLLERRAAAVRSHRQQAPVHPHVLGQAIADVLDDDATVIYDSFTGTGYLTDKLEINKSGRVLDAGLHQALGHSIGMAIGAQVARPGKQVLSLIGDGGFGISAMDMETMLRYNLPAVVVVLNNDSWGGRSIGREDYYPRMGSWEITPDQRYDEAFRALGCHGEYVASPADLRPALDRAFSSGKPAVVNVRSDATSLHPVRLRENLIDVWSRNNQEEISERARRELSTISLSALQRTQKATLDVYFGRKFPLRELAETAGVDLDK